MRDLYNILENHTSIRKYKSDPVSKEVLERILNASIQGTSSSGNMQTYSVIITTDKKIKEELYPLHFEQEMVLEAPVMMTFCCDFNRMRLWLKENKAKDNFDNFMSFMIGAIDAILFSQTVAIASEAEGLGICYMGTTLANCLKISEVLNLPENVIPVVGYSLGYPDEKPKTRDRLPLEGLVHYDTYKNYEKEDISKIYQERETKGWDRYMSNSELKEMVEKSGVENLAQIYTSLKYTKESHIEYSNTILKCLEKHNFFNN